MWSMEIIGIRLLSGGKAEAGSREAPTPRLGLGDKMPRHCCLFQCSYSLAACDAAGRSFLLTNIVVCSYLRMYQNLFQRQRSQQARSFPKQQARGKEACKLCLSFGAEVLVLLDLAEFSCFAFWDGAKRTTAMCWCYPAVYTVDQKCCCVYP